MDYDYPSFEDMDLCVKLTNFKPPNKEHFGSSIKVANLSLLERLSYSKKLQPYCL